MTDSMTNALITGTIGIVYVGLMLSVSKLCWGVWWTEGSRFMVLGIAAATIILVAILWWGLT